MITTVSNHLTSTHPFTDWVTVIALKNHYSEHLANHRLYTQNSKILGTIEL